MTVLPPPSLERDPAVVKPLRNLHALGIVRVWILARISERLVDDDLLTADSNLAAGTSGLEGEGDAVVGAGHHLTLGLAKVVQLEVSAVAALETNNLLV